MTSTLKTAKKLHDFLQDVDKIIANVNQKDLQGLKNEGAQQYKKLLDTINAFKEQVKDYVNDENLNEGMVRKVIAEVSDKFDMLKSSKPVHDFYDDSQDFFAIMKKAIIKHPIQAGVISALLLIIIGKK